MNGDAPSLSRHARHFALDQVGTGGQQRIADGRALLIGVGGIGCAAASYLVSSGVGRVVISDFDTVDPTNLDRQMLYGPADVGKPKAACAMTQLQRINPDVRIEAIGERLAGDALSEAVSGVDVVLGGPFRFPARIPA